MMKRSLLLLAAVGMTLILSACGQWGRWGDHSHSSHNNNSHSHHRGCAHSGY